MAALPIYFFFLTSLCLRTSGASTLWKRDLKFGRVGAFLVEIKTDLVKLSASGKHGCACLEELFRGKLLKFLSAKRLATAPAALQLHPAPPFSRGTPLPT